MAIELFISYSHKDEALKVRLEAHLSVLRYNGQISYWHDRKILAGQNWREQISEHLERAQVILLLISPDFMNSGYCTGIEMRRAMQRHLLVEAIVIPIILAQVADWQSLQFRNGDDRVKLGDLQALPSSAKAVITWTKYQLAFYDIANGIKRVIENSGLDVSRPQEVIRTAVDIPTSIPYLCNRARPEEILERIIDRRRRNKSVRPLICIAYGNDDECHQQFKDRLCKSSLPKYFRINTREASIIDFYLQLPAFVEPYGEAKDLLENRLAARFNVNDASLENIIGAIASFNAPVMVFSRLRADTWGNGGREIANMYLKFWSEFPNLPNGRQLIACLLMIHDTEQQGNVDIRPDIAKFLKNLKLLQADNLGEATAASIDSGVVLGLEPVEENEATDWLLVGEDFSFCENHERKDFFLEKSAEDLRKHYLSVGPAIPMKRLAPVISDILKKNLNELR